MTAKNAWAGLGALHFGVQHYRFVADCHVSITTAVDIQIPNSEYNIVRTARHFVVKIIPPAVTFIPHLPASAHALPSTNVISRRQSMSIRESLTTAARSSCPAGAAGFDKPPAFGFGAAAGGLDADGTGGFPPTFGGAGAPGFAAKGGGPGFGFGAGGGAFDASELLGRELVGVVSTEEPFVPVDAVFFQGAADPFAGIIPGKTATGFAEGSAVIGFGKVLDAAGAAGAAAAAGATGGGRRPAGGGGGAGAAFGFGGTSSR